MAFEPFRVYLLQFSFPKVYFFHSYIEFLLNRSCVIVHLTVAPAASILKNRLPK